MNEIVNKRKEIGDYIFVSKYAQTRGGRKETWEESVERVMSMHRQHIDDLGLDFERRSAVLHSLESVQALYNNQIILGSQRALQYGGEGMLRHNIRTFNCSGAYINRIEFYQELMYLLLCGCGCGYSVQRVHTEQLPVVKGVDTSWSHTYTIPDSVEGWSYAINELVKSHYLGLAKVVFDYSEIRPKGSYITGGFKAPGPEPLKKCLEKMDKVLGKIRGRKATPFELHRLACLVADAVISGGIRRSALLCQFDADDEEMLFCKTGNWFAEYPELARANNSAIILPTTPREVYERIFKAIRQFGEPGVIFSNHVDVIYNPCCFVGETRLLTETGYMNLKDLSGYMNLHAMNSDGELVPVRAWSNGFKHIITVTLSNGTTIKCTPDHRFMLRDGNECEARYLLGETVKGYDGTEFQVVSLVDDGELEEVFDFALDSENHWGVVEGVIAHNCEVSGYPQIEVDGKIQYGWFFCNLTEINASKIKTRKEFYEACEAAATLGTVQASYTDFKVVAEATRLIAERDALIGVGMTGMCENPDIVFDPSIQRNGAERVKEANQRMAALLGINPAARCTVVKPSGNSSQLLGCTSSGIHKFPFKRFIRNIQAANTEQAFQVLKEVNPFAVKPSAYNPEVESVVSFPVELGEQVLTTEGSTAIDFLELVKLTKENWIEEGTNKDHPFYKDHPDFAWMRMNVSNTVTVRDDEWEDVKNFVWDNRSVFSGISFLPHGGDLLYPQAPYTSVLDERELAERYGAGAILAGGLIIDGLAVFDDNLWLACDVAMGRNDRHLKLTRDDITDFISRNLTDDGQLLVNVNGVMISDVNAISSYLQSVVDKKVDWVRRFKKFAGKYLGGDLEKTERCLKHVSLFHRWQKLKDMKPIDWSAVEWEEKWVDVGETAAQGCAGGACELK